MRRGAKLLITGASGFTGQHACKFFHEQGYEVVASSRKRSPFNMPWTNIPANLLNKEEMEEVLSTVQPDAILHLAGQNDVSVSWKNPLDTLEANMLATLYLLESVRNRVPACRVVVVGSNLQVENENGKLATHPYGLSKTLQELIAMSWNELFNLDIVIAKPSNLIGPGVSKGICSILAQKMIEIELLKREPVMEVHSLASRRDFLDVRDAVKGYDVLISCGVRGEIYDLSTGKGTSISEVIEELQSLTSLRVTINQISPLAVSEYVGNPEKTMQLGWKPSFSLRSSTQDILNYYRELIKPNGDYIR